ncbi:MAG: hypothetical protein QM692_19385 [Thermomicrobiales bacterium]
MPPLQALLAISPADALATAVRAAALAAGLSALENLVDHRTFEAHGILAWRVRARGETLRAFRWLSTPLGVRALTGRGVTAITTGVLALAITLLAWPMCWPAALGLLALEVVCLVRNRPGADAADQMIRIILVIGAVAGLVGTPWFAAAACLILAGHLGVGYFTSGVWKGMATPWLSGQGFCGTLTTEYFSHGAVARVVHRHPRIGHAAAISVVLWECSAFVALGAGPWLFWPWLALGIAFHLGSAQVMGLPGFAITFIGCYPALIVANRLLTTTPELRPLGLLLALGSVLIAGIFIAHERGRRAGAGNRTG